MKIKAIAAAGAIGLGMGVAGLITAGSASADRCGENSEDMPAGPIGTGKIICNIQSNGASFFMSVSPAYNAQVLLNGTADNPELGLLDWPTTFVNSVGDFLDGPRAPGGPVAPDTGSSTP